MITRRCGHCWVIGIFHISWPWTDWDYTIVCDNCKIWPKLKVPEDLTMEYDDLLIRVDIFNKSLEKYCNNF